jgi:AraC family transcriptional regulator
MRAALAATSGGERAELVDFATGDPGQSMEWLQKATSGGVTVARCRAVLNGGSSVASKQILVGVHLGPPTRLAWRLTGEAETRTALIRPGSVSVQPTHERVWRSWEDAALTLIVAIDPGFFSEVRHNIARPGAELADGTRLTTQINVDDPQIRQLATLHAARLDAPDAADPLYLHSLATALTIHLLRHYAARGVVAPRSQRSGLSRTQLRLITEHIDGHLEEPLALSDLARVVGLSLSHFAHSFKSSAGVTPHRYVIMRRIHRARALLAQPDARLADISAALGFASQSHFTHHFRQITGMTPARYLKAL